MSDSNIPSGKNQQSVYDFGESFQRKLEIINKRKSEQRQTRVKRCTQCGFECPFPEAERHFFHYWNTADGLTDKCKRCLGVYQEEHRDEITIWSAAWRKSPQGRASAKAASHNRRYHFVRAGRPLTANDVDQIIAAHTDNKGRLRCARCGKIIKGAYHLDHFIPLAKGGTNDPGNYRVMHPYCNQSKHAKLPVEIGMLI